MTMTITVVTAITVITTMTTIATMREGPKGIVTTKVTKSMCKYELHEERKAGKRHGKRW